MLTLRVLFIIAYEVSCRIRARTGRPIRVQASQLALPGIHPLPRSVAAWPPQQYGSPVFNMKFGLYSIVRSMIPIIAGWT